MEAQSLSACNQCGKRFQRKAHLLRHQQQHSGDRPYSCKFCSKTFKRSDVLRDHFSRCERRGSSEIPSSLERGRKRHACDECSRLKVKCDSETPCRKCREFGRLCVKSRPPVTSTTVTTTTEASNGEISPINSTNNHAPPLSTSPAAGAPTPPTTVTTPDITSDRNSIGFLLNFTGDSEFMHEFPKSMTLSPSVKSAEYPASTVGSANASSSSVYHQQNPPVCVANTTTADGQYYDSTQDPPDSLDVFLRSLELTNVERLTDTWDAPDEGPSSWAGPGAECPYGDTASLEQRAFDARSKLGYTAASISSPNPPSKELIDAIAHMTAERFVINIGLYFRHWHKHAPMLHRGTFDPRTMALPLLLTVFSLGGMYSKHSEDVNRVKILLDTCEGYIYSIPGFNDEYDVPSRVHEGQEEGSEEWQQYRLEELSGAYLILVLQHWTGNDIARARARHNRFDKIAGIFHDMGLQTYHHDPIDNPVDQASFIRWARKECYIRMTSLAMMLDGSFGIFNNVPPRFQWAEIDLAFPSNDEYFESATYAETVANMRTPKPKINIKDAFLLLFATGGENSESVTKLKESRLSPLDMQMLIHVVYTHLWTQTFNNPLISLPSTSIAGLMAPFKTALANWKVVWDSLRAQFRDSEWKKLGYQTKAETYYNAVRGVAMVFEEQAGSSVGGSWGRNLFQAIPGDTEKGTHLRRLLRLGQGQGPEWNGPEKCNPRSATDVGWGLRNEV